VTIAEDTFASSHSETMLPAITNADLTAHLYPTF